MQLRPKIWECSQAKGFDSWDILGPKNESVAITLVCSNFFCSANSHSGHGSAAARRIRRCGGVMQKKRRQGSGHALAFEFGMAMEH